MENTTNQPTLPYQVVRSIRKYRSSLRADIEKAVRSYIEAGGTPAPSEIGRLAMEVIFGTGEYDRETERVCLEQVAQGKFKYLEDLIDECQEA